MPSTQKILIICLYNEWNSTGTNHSFISYPFCNEVENKQILILPSFCKYRVSLVKNRAANLLLSRFQQKWIWIKPCGFAQIFRENVSLFNWNWDIWDLMGFYSCPSLGHYWNNVLCLRFLYNEINKKGKDNMDKTDRAQESDPLTDPDGGHLFNDIKSEMRNIKCRLKKIWWQNLTQAMQMRLFPGNYKLSSNSPLVASRVSVSTSIVASVSLWFWNIVLVSW